MTEPILINGGTVIDGTGAEPGAASRCCSGTARSRPSARGPRSWPRPRPA